MNGLATTAAEIIRAAVPEASDAFCDHVLWGRTPFPFWKVTARDLYRAASRVARAQRNGRVLCDQCDNQAAPGKYLCATCAQALASAAAGGEALL
jgi:hypothetical protein